VISIGTSGFSYPEWKGSFYPEDMPTSKMLPYYSDRLSTVEINNTFYRMPSKKVLGDWSAATPDLPSRSRRPDVSRTLRSSGTAPMSSRPSAPELKRSAPNLGYCCSSSLPTSGRMQRCWASSSSRCPRAPAPHSNSGTGPGTPTTCSDQLRARNLALCIADSEKLTTPVVATADYGYLRLRDEGYQEADFAKWAETIRRHEDVWGDTFVYFKHEEEGKGPEFARALEKSLKRRTGR